MVPKQFSFSSYPTLHPKKRPEKINKGKNIYQALQKELLNYGMPWKHYSLFTSSKIRDVGNCGTASWVFSKPWNNVHPSFPQHPAAFFRGLYFPFHCPDDYHCTCLRFISSASWPHTETLLNSGEVWICKTTSLYLLKWTMLKSTVVFHALP